MIENCFETDLSVNVLPPRAYYIPFGDAAFSRDRRASDRFLSLDGTWRLTPYECVADADGFWTRKGQYEIAVPSCVQTAGFDRFQYTNYAYPFPFDPPRVPKKNPCFHYSRRLTLRKEEGRKYYLVFEGVDSCFYLYLNGVFVGFSQGSHRISEFDATEALLDGENKLDVLVVKWCFGSYLEDQDKWRWTGIFRSVYLLTRPAEHIVDYRVVTRIEGPDGVIVFENRSPLSVDVQVEGESRRAAAGQSVSFRIRRARFWSAESPALYDVMLSANGERILERVGVRTTEVRDGVYRLNGRPVKFYGVNRHDFHPEKGAAVSYEDMLADIRLMKSLHVNALRTSHYPASPLLYELCDEYGIYVVSESDVETHGSVADGSGLPYERGFDSMAGNPLFTHSVCERQKQNVETFKNRACVVLWSLGNESGWGPNLIAALRTVKACDDRPVHYEGIQFIDRETAGPDAFYEAGLDVISRMYPPAEWITDGYLRDEKERRPLVLCEYAHAMGNGPGGLREYWEAFDSSERLMGGFIWEWADHGIAVPGGSFRYGGDFGECPHDGNFCLDGIVTADRKLKAGSLQMKKTYQPVAFFRSQTGVTVRNRNYFAPLTGTLVLRGGAAETRTEVRIPPRGEVFVPWKDGSTLLAGLYAPDGSCTAYEQFYVDDFCPTPMTPTAAAFEKDRSVMRVRAGRARYRFSLLSGELLGLTFDGVEYPGLSLNLWRAPIDNDRDVARQWDEALLSRSVPDVTDWRTENGVLRFSLRVGAARRAPVLWADVTYAFFEEGVTLSTSYRQAEGPFRRWAFLPRVGWTMRLDGSFDRLKYRAYGPGETYPDLYEYAVKDDYVSDVASQYYPYARPQENGSHYRPDYVEIGNGTSAIRVEGMESFSALPFSAAELAAAAHADELKPSGATWLSLDHAVTGVGSGACGPLPGEAYRVPAKGEGSLRLLFRRFDCPNKK
ncbi:MAG: hypothetical protein KIG36_01100 [Eubacteriales bacterium]|nr:hypothetical protein [Eubacteriales bacterium]